MGPGTNRGRDGRRTGGSSIGARCLAAPILSLLFFIVGVPGAVGAATSAAIVPPGSALGTRPVAPAVASATLGGNLVYSLTTIDPDSGESSGGLRIDRGARVPARSARLTGDPTESEPTFSPSGGLIAFAYSHNLGSSAHGIATVHSDGTGLRHLTEGEYDESPAFSPDGSQIAFDHDGTIDVIGVDGSGLRSVTVDPGGTDSQPAFTPDGRAIVFTRTYNPGHSSRFPILAKGLYSVPAAGGPIETLIDGKSDETNVTFSPDGKLMAYNDQKFLIVANSDGTDRRRLNGLFSGSLGPENTEGTDPVFSPDSRYLAFRGVAFDSESYEVRLGVIRLGSRPKLLGSVARAAGGIEGGSEIGAPAWGRGG